jgi:hypothetical protein
LFLLPLQSPSTPRPAPVPLLYMANAADRATLDLLSARRASASLSTSGTPNASKQVQLLNGRHWTISST